MQGHFGLKLSVEGDLCAIISVRNIKASVFKTVPEYRQKVLCVCHKAPSDRRRERVCISCRGKNQFRRLEYNQQKITVLSNIRESKKYQAN